MFYFKFSHNSQILWKSALEIENQTILKDWPPHENIANFPIIFPIFSNLDENFSIRAS